MLKLRILNHIIIISLLFISSCDLSKDNIFAPNKKLFKMLPNGPASFQQGFLDGCETGLATGFANDYYKSFYKYKKDVNMIKQKNALYTRAWSASMIYCRHYAFGTLKEAGMPPKLPGDKNASKMVLGEHSLLGNVLDLRKQGGLGLKHW
jgi:hypothetical protein